MNLDLKKIFSILEDYVIIKFNNQLPSYHKNDDIDILTSNILKNKNIIIDWYDKSLYYHKIVKINNSHLQLDIFLIGENNLTLRFDLFEKLNYTKFSLDDNICRIILKNKIYNNLAFVPSLEDDLSLRYCEYIEYIDRRKDKIKHLNYVNNFSIPFYKIKEGEQKSKLNYKNVDTMYNSIIIWGHGIKYTNDIINSLLENIDCDILNIKENDIDDIDKFIRKCYKLEMINLNHIMGKTKYLKSIEKKYTHILIKNYNARLKEYGEGKYKVIADENIVNWKWKIREKYNPRDINVNMKPLSKGITHNHVIHVTDEHKECDYLCETLLNNVPSFYENKFNNNLLVPWHVNIKVILKIEIVDINKLTVNLAESLNMKVKDTPHYEYLNGNKQTYINYFNKYIGKCLEDNHSPLQFDRLISKFKPELYNFEESRLIICNEKYLVCDGLHRLSILKKNNISRVKVCMVN